MKKRFQRLPSVTLLLSDTESKTEYTFLRQVVCGIGCTLGAVTFAGCSSSGSGGFYADARFAVAGEETFAQSIESMEEGEELALPMYQEGYTAEGVGHTPTHSGQAANFTLRLDEGGHSVTIETPGDSFSWEPGSVDVGGGILIASDIQGDEAMTEATLFSRYFDYVHFGLWEVSHYTEEFDHERTEGGVFHQGFETERANMPSTGSATYEGGMIGKVYSGGEPGFEIDGTFTLHADFEGRSVHGIIDSLGQFNNIDLEKGSIHGGNRFSGAAVTTSSDAAGSFAEGVEGRYDGGFFGPSAEEAGGTWRLEDRDNLAVGAFGGPRQ